MTYSNSDFNKMSVNATAYSVKCSELRKLSKLT